MGDDSLFEWAVAGRPRPGELVSGDDAVVIRQGERSLLAVIDGLGHGPDAATATGCARSVIEKNVDAPLDRLLGLCHQALIGTRGVAMTIAAVRHTTGALEWLGIGNVEAARVRDDRARGVHLVDTVFQFSGVVGYLLPDIHIPSTTIAFGDVLLFATDGIASAFLDDVDTEAPMPTMAQRLLDRHARPVDDALVLAARYLGHPTGE